MSAAEILRMMVQVGQVDLFAESLQGMEYEQEVEVMRRSRKAEELGFVLANDYGIFVLTDKGREYLASVGEAA